MLRLGIASDFREEKWPSMDLVADMLLHEIREGRAGDVEGESLCPAFKKRFMRLPLAGKSGIAFNADRLLNRMRDYPRHFAKAASDFDCFHICDHAYANLCHVLPPERTGVFCHDLDTFRCLFEPQKERRPRWFKSMMRRVLSGIQKAALVFHTTLEIRRQILLHGIVDEAQLVQAPYGVSPIFSSGESFNSPRQSSARPYILHVGSCIPRKRIDVLLDVFFAIRKSHPELRLFQVGGEWSSEQRAQLSRLNLVSDAEQTGRMTQEQIATLYRGARMVLQPSDAEGFGLPVAEALACGAVVVASSIAALQEVGGGAVTYCAPGDVGAWVAAVDRILNNPDSAPSLSARLAQASRFSWTTHARTICDAYRTLV
jgi:glycosyltransferase involved in cell wall biosynthesis